MGKQMRVWAHTTLNGDVAGRVLLEARAGQVPFIYGYKLDVVPVTGTDFASGDDVNEGALYLQGNPKATQTPAIMGGSQFDALVKHRGNLGVLAFRWRVSGAPVLDLGGSQSSGWMPCEFEVPGLWLVVQNFNVNATPLLIGMVHVLFDWVNRTSEQIAALYTQWGIDAVDATERQVTGEIDFARTPGDGDMGAIIG